MNNVKDSKPNNKKVKKNFAQINLDSLLLELDNKITSGHYKISIYGLGHVGSPLAATWLRSGACVIGIDKSKKVVDLAKKGKTHIPEPGVSEAFSEGIFNKRFFVYSDLVKASRDSLLKMICVPVLAPDGSADLLAVKTVTKEIAKGLKKNDIVSLNPSVPPGTTEDLVVPILEKYSGLKVEDDFYVVYNPERIYEGRAIEDIESNYPGIISGYGKKSLIFGTKLFSRIYQRGIISMSNIKSAETEKLFEGVYRDVNIALANELAIYSENLGIDFWEVRAAANSQPYCHIHRPGVGVGGACIPVYPQFIINSSKNIGINSKMTKLGRVINNSMPKYCVKQALKLVRTKKCTNLIITLLGLAFRGGVTDTRLSPTYEVIKVLNTLKVKEIRVHDPLIENDDLITKFANTSFYNNFYKSIEKTDLIMILTDHSEYKTIASDVTDVPIYDGRGILDREGHANNNVYSVIGLGKYENILN